jgi:hypothetical protein
MLELGKDSEREKDDGYVPGIEELEYTNLGDL